MWLTVADFEAAVVDPQSPLDHAMISFCRLLVRRVVLIARLTCASTSMLTCTISASLIRAELTSITLFSRFVTILSAIRRSSSTACPSLTRFYHPTMCRKFIVEMLNSTDHLSTSYFFESTRSSSANLFSKYIFIALSPLRSYQQGHGALLHTVSYWSRISQQPHK